MVRVYALEDVRIYIYVYAMDSFCVYTLHLSKRLRGLGGVLP
jgi:hypothetical protein